jgi:hypothetical protein
VITLKKKEALISAGITLLVFLFGQGILSKIYFSPSLTYELLPAHQIDTQETRGIIIKNGRTLLHNVVISLKSNHPILKIRLDGPEIINTTGEDYIVSGKLGENAIKLRIDRLMRKSNYSLTLLTMKEPTIGVTISSDEIDAVEEKAQTGAGFVEYMILFLLGLTAGSGTYAYLRLRRLVARKDCDASRRESGMKLKNVLDECVIMLKETNDNIELMKAIHQDKDKLLSLAATEEGRAGLVEAFAKTQEIINEINLLLKGYADSVVVEGICYESKEKSKTDIKKEKDSVQQKNRGDR